MYLEIIWSEFAEKQLELIYEYYQENVSEKVGNKLVRSIIKETDKLVKEPFLGQEEELLKNREITYRYLIYKNYKIIYSIDQGNEWIKIADVFDTRQNPNKLNRSQ